MVHSVDVQSASSCFPHLHWRMWTDVRPTRHIYAHPLPTLAYSRGEEGAVNFQRPINSSLRYWAVSICLKEAVICPPLTCLKTPPSLDMANINEWQGARAHDGHSTPGASQAGVRPSYGPRCGNGYETEASGWLQVTDVLDLGLEQPLTLATMVPRHGLPECQSPTKERGTMLAPQDARQKVIPSCTPSQVQPSPPAAANGLSPGPDPHPMALTPAALAIMSFPLSRPSGGRASVGPPLLAGSGGQEKGARCHWSLPTLARGPF